MMMKSGRNWRVIGKCIRGASHIRNDMPCQDALRIENAKKYHIIALSDGHGSSSCPYSDEGAKAAVDTAVSVFSSIFSKEDPLQTISANKDIWLPKQIEQHWKNAVRDIHKLKERDEEPDFPYELYGATLLVLVVTDTFTCALQLGDGDILSIEPVSDSEIEDNDNNTQNLRISWVIPPDDNLGPETNSLCQDDCWKHMQTKIIALDSENKGAMFLLSTDGYANSFYNDDGFKKAGADFYNLLNEQGLTYIEDNLEGWLMESSAQGSGDDITMALVL